MGTTFQIQYWREVEDTEQTGVQDELNATYFDTNEIILHSVD